MKKALFLCLLFCWPIAGYGEETEKDAPKKLKELDEHPDKAQAARELKQSDEVDEKMAELANKIKTEIDILGKHPWAGLYFEGDGLGKNLGLVLAPKEGFAFEWHGCMGIYDRNYGKIEEKNGKLHLAFTLPNSFRACTKFCVSGVGYVICTLSWRAFGFRT